MICKYTFTYILHNYLNDQQNKIKKFHFKNFILGKLYFKTLFSKIRPHFFFISSIYFEIIETN